MNYISVRVSTLRGDQKVSFDTYIKINEKYILYLRRGDSLEGQRLHRFKQNKVKKLYINNDDEQSYLSYLEKNIEIAYDNKSSTDMNTRAEIIHGAQQKSADEVFANPESVANYNYAKQSAGKYVDFIMSNNEALKSIMNIDNPDKDIAHHGVVVSTLAVALAQKMGITEAKKLQLLTLGSLLHDFGHFESKLNINQPLANMTPEEHEIWRKHPQVGAEKVADKNHFDRAIINIISQHEETSNGLGPLKLLEKDIDPLALIVSSANAVDRMLTFDGIPKTEAAKSLMVDKMGLHPLVHLQHLTQIIKSL